MKTKSSSFHDEPKDLGALQEPMTLSFVDRYFLRRLAIARRKGDRVIPAAAYSEAKVEAIAVVILMPVIAILSGVALLSLHWQLPGHVAKLPPKYIAVVVTCAACAVVGNLCFDGRFRKLSQDPAICLRFDTDADRSTATMQKFIVFTVCGAVVPILALLVVFLLS